MRRLAVLIGTLVAALALSASPALAHVNEAADRAVGPPVHAEPQGHGHAGMECGAQHARTPLVPLGLDCPADL